MSTFVMFEIADEVPTKHIVLNKNEITSILELDTGGCEIRWSGSENWVKVPDEISKVFKGLNSDGDNEPVGRVAVRSRDKTSSP
jgi:hypothetical protein